MKKLFLISAMIIAVNVLANEQHEYVDLGLPSGTKWATMNVGADSIEGIGAFFAFGDPTPDYITPGKTTGYERSFDWAHYRWCAADEKEGDFRYQMTKYCLKSDYGYKGFVDGLSTLLPEDDAATVHWGAQWRTPTLDEYMELENNTTFEMVTQKGVYGLRATSRVPGYEDRSIFFPCVGVRDSGNWHCMDAHDTIAYYMTATLEETMSFKCDCFVFPDDIYNIISNRIYGSNVRPVYVDAGEHRTAVDLGLSSLWSVVNIGTTFFDRPGWYFPWGEAEHVSGKDATWENYNYGTENNLTKYNNNPDYGTVDGKVVLDIDDDPAAYNWGEDWHMPDTADWNELYTQCTWTWTEMQQSSGYLIQSKVSGYEQAQIFLPTSGYHEGIYSVKSKTDFYYFTKYLNQANPNQAISVHFSQTAPMTIGAEDRYLGFACRPVKTKPGTDLRQIRDTASGGLNEKQKTGYRKVLQNGRFVIETNGGCYDALGQKVR